MTAPSTLLRDAHVVINGASDISQYVKDVKLPFAAAMLDDTAMGDTTKSSQAGLKEWSVTLNAFQSFIAANLDAILFPLVGVEIAVLIRPTSAAKGVDNPEFTGTGILQGYDPVSGTVGQLAMTAITIQARGPLARAVA